MRNIIFSAVLAGLTSGCGSSEEIWAFYINAASDPVNERVVSSNFNGTVPIDNGTTTGGEWTNTYSEESSPSTIVANHGAAHVGVRRIPDAERDPFRNGVLGRCRL